jgi:hypothetical protein
MLRQRPSSAAQRNVVMGSQGSAVNRRGGGHNKIAGDVRGENVAEGKKTDEVNHSSDDAQQRR